MGFLMAIWSGLSSCEHELLCACCFLLWTGINEKVHQDKCSPNEEIPMKADRWIQEIQKAWMVTRHEGAETRSVQDCRVPRSVGAFKLNRDAAIPSDDRDSGFGSEMQHLAYHV